MAVYKVTHPFCKYPLSDGTHAWTIGCEVEEDRTGRDTWYCHGEGKKVMTEISRHTPPGYGEKVFFSVQYIDPDGNEIGQKRLHMLGVKAFERRASGFIHDYEVESY